MSNLSEEEQEAIEIIQKYLKTSIANEQRNDFFKDGGWEVIDIEIAVSIKTLMNYISKLQKELEKANKQLDLDYVDNNYVSKEEYEKLQKEIEVYKREIELQGYVTLNYVSKDKIKDKIKELKQDKDFDEDVYVEEFAVDVLEDLLEE